ncbi:CbtB domain-containing protein [Rhodoligotrophos defluvii]|uniref:CbtB domain-containing protein n=1 Tax=Rhodoligotrophos defluvii TaxID=2561934 RepID=UPI0010C9A424|nr:CbtB domain-containing protein [Rhodoligotrophos defluvii]
MARNVQTTASANVPSTSSSVLSRLAAPALLFVMGAGLVFLAGFSHAQSLHDAAHDTRHALSYPCH